MKADIKSLVEVLNSAREFRIPQYQRPYVWTKEEVKQIWSDLEGAWRDAAENGKATEDTQTYFLGPIVVANESDATGAKLSNVVDGQQRLTTLHSLLWITHNRLTGLDSAEATEKSLELKWALAMPSRQAKLRVAGGDQSNFQAIREGTVLDETRELGDMGRILREKVGGLIAEELVKFANYLLNMTRFVLVETDSYADAWALFIGLNGKGKQLNPADLIKAFVCGTACDYTACDGAAMAAIWEKQVLPLGNDATSALLEICRVVADEPGSDAKLFKIFEQNWRASEITPTLLTEGCTAYQRFWLEPLEKIQGLDSAIRRGVRCLRALRRRDVTSVLIALASRFGFETLFNPRLVAALEAYQLWMAISGLRGRERKFAGLARAIFKGNASGESLDLTQSLHELKILLASMAPSQEDVFKAVESSAYRGQVMLFIVKSYEEGIRGDVHYDEVWYEHLMPQTGTEFWYTAAGTSDPNAYARIVNNIGNIVPLDPNTNIKNRNNPWGEKSSLLMAEVPNWLAAGIARLNPDGWTPPKIASRAKEIAKWAVETRWKLPEALEQLP